MLSRGGLVRVAPNADGRGPFNISLAIKGIDRSRTCPSPQLRSSQLEVHRTALPPSNGRCPLLH